MFYGDLLRLTVLLAGAVATALGAVAVVIANREVDETALIVAVSWWLVAAVGGLALGRSAAAAEEMARVLAEARTATQLPPESAARIAFMRLWPVGAFALLVGAAGWVWPQVAAIGAGFSILVALTLRSREPAVAAIEERDGVRFYVEPSSALQPVKLIRTPGLYRDRAAQRQAPATAALRPGELRAARMWPGPRVGDGAAERRRERRDAAEDEPGARARDLGEPADERPADRRRAEEDDRVEGHHAAPHRRRRTELEGRVDRGREGHAGEAERREREHRDGERRRRGDAERTDPEPGRGDDDRALADPAPGAHEQRTGDRADRHRDRERRVRGRARRRR